MTPNEIKAAIQRAGTSQAAIAEYLGLNASTVMRVVNKKGRSARVEAELKKICGKDVFDKPAKIGRPKSVWTGSVGVSA